eukprot:scaffold6733_cov77-Cyclotella_meneghiniana.AAC.8
MYDEDEDIVDFDEYVSKMREDGEWGGNVELVVASRVYKRNVRIYSGLYDGGVMLIQYQEQEEMAKNPHDRKGKQTKNYYQQYDEHDEGIVYFGDLLLSYHENDHYNSVHSNDKSKTDDQFTHDNTQNEDSTKDNMTTSTSMTLSIKSTRKPRKGTDCPCGSGIKYKKCCAVKEKTKARAAKLKQNHGEDEDEKKDDLSDGFKVLTI